MQPHCCQVFIDAGAMRRIVIVKCALPLQDPKGAILLRDAAARVAENTRVMRNEDHFDASHQPCDRGGPQRRELKPLETEVSLVVEDVARRIILQSVRRFMRVYEQS